MNISKKIKGIRKSKGLSQQNVADIIGINRVQYTRIENGNSEPTISTLEKVANALEVQLVGLISDNGSYDINSYDKTIVEKVKLIETLDDEQKKSLFTFIDTAIANKRFKDFFQQQLAS